jgi:hypothetical protein
MNRRTSLLVIAPVLCAASSALAQAGGPYDLSWSTIDGGGATFSTGGPYSLGGTIGQPDAGPAAPMTGGAFSLVGGFWLGAGDWCQPDCNHDGTLTVADFGCFQTKFVLGDPYADCNADGTLTVADFGCFQTKFVQGCP